MVNIENWPTPLRPWHFMNLLFLAMILIFVTVPNNGGAAMSNDSKLSQTVTFRIKEMEEVLHILFFEDLHKTLA